MAAEHFFIRKGSNLPVLQLKVYNDGRNEYKDIFERLENAAITFSMVDEKTGKYKVFNKQGLIIPVQKNVCPEETEYYIGYKFTTKDTNTPGCYRGEFKIDFLDDGCSLIVPIREELYINVLDSTTMSKIIC
jgi:hypothetical protein